MNQYRNKKDITSFEGITIDAGSLWERHGELMILVDEDQYITAAYSITDFIKV